MDDAKRVPLPVDDFIALEFLRLVAAINQTDPRGRDYAQLLENIERFGATATLLPDIWNLVGKYYERQGEEFPNVSPVAEEGEEPQYVKPFKAASVEETAEEPEQPEAEPVKEEPEPTPIEEKPEEKPEPAPAKPKEDAPSECAEYDAVTVKKAIGKARADGVVVKIKDFLVENWGVEGFSALPATKYGEVMEKLKELGAMV